MHMKMLLSGGWSAVLVALVLVSRADTVWAQQNGNPKGSSSKTTTTSSATKKLPKAEIQRIFWKVLAEDDAVIDPEFQKIVYLARRKGALEKTHIEAFERRKKQVVAKRLPPKVAAAKPMPEKTAKAIAAKLIPSVVILTMLDADNKPIGLGSGFVVSPGIIATNYHVIKGTAKGGAKLVSDPTTAEYLREIEGVVCVDQEHDLALLKVSGIKAKPLDLGFSANVSIGDTVYAVGNPEGLQGTFSQGLVSGVRDITAESRLIQITAAISPGSSGGPVSDEQGKVIGVATSQIVAGQNLNFAVPSSYLQRLMTKSLDGVRTTVRPLSDPLGIAGAAPVTKVGDGTLPPPTRVVIADSSDVLKGLKGVDIVVEDMSDDATKLGLTTARLQSAIELSLRRNGVRVLTKEERIATRGMPYLYVNVNVLSNAFSITVNLQEDIRLERDSGTLVGAATIWSKGSVGTHGGEADYIVKSVERKVDQFCLDYLKANPK